MKSLDKLKEIVRGQIEGQFGQMTRQRVKRQLLDKLDEHYNPSSCRKNCSTASSMSSGVRSKKT